MNICIVSETAFPAYGGGCVQAERVCRLLAKKHRIVFLTSKKSREELVPRNVKLYKFRSITAPLTSKSFNIPFALIKQVKSILREENVQLTHIFMPTLPLGLAVLLAAKQLNIPVLSGYNLQIENISKNVPLIKQKRIINALYKGMNYVLNKSDVVHCPSRFAEKLYRSTGGESRVVVISNGVDTSFFKKKNNKSVRALRKKLSKPAEKILLFVGRLMREKNVGVLIRAFAILQRERPELRTRLIISGKGGQERNLRKLAEKLGVNKKVVFTGYVEEKHLPSIYSVADVFILPSLVELQSIVTLEAMASSLPIIIADSPTSAAPELVRKGRNGYLFRHDSPEDLARKIVLLIKDEEKIIRFGKNSRRIAEQEHDIREVIKKISRVHKELVEHRKPGKPVRKYQKKQKNNKNNYTTRLSLLLLLRKRILTSSSSS